LIQSKQEQEEEKERTEKLYASQIEAIKKKVDEAREIKDQLEKSLKKKQMVTRNTSFFNC